MASLPSLHKEKLDALKEEFCALLRSAERAGMEELIAYLEQETGLFHGSCEHQQTRRALRRTGDAQHGSV